MKQLTNNYSSIHGIPQARILEWAAISFSNACMHAKPLQSCPTLCNPMQNSDWYPESAPKVYQWQ